jgi:hypothetical protein
MVLAKAVSVAQKKRTPPRKSRKSKASTKKNIAPDECVTPPQVNDQALNLFKFDPGKEREADRISGYVEWQCAKDAERVTYLEKIRTENVFGTDYDCWNVRTDKERYAQAAACEDNQTFACRFLDTVSARRLAEELLKLVGVSAILRVLVTADRLWPPSR